MASDRAEGRARSGKASSRGEGRANISTPAAIALGEAENDPAVADEAAAFLREQRSLTKLQVDHFIEEHRHALRGSRASQALEVMKIILQGALTLLVIAAAILFASMIWNASRDHSLVIERFAVPPDLSNSQINGEQLAALVADKLATINAKASSFRAENTFDVDWGKDINIEVPGSGNFAWRNRSIAAAAPRPSDPDRRDVVSSGFGAAAFAAYRIGRGNDGRRSMARISTRSRKKRRRRCPAQRNPIAIPNILSSTAGPTRRWQVARRTADSNAPADERAWAWAQISNLLSAKDMPTAHVPGTAPSSSIHRMRLPISIRQIAKHFSAMTIAPAPCSGARSRFPPMAAAALARSALKPAQPSIGDGNTI